MLAELFGGNTAEKILLCLAAIGEGCPAEIARTFKISASIGNRVFIKPEGMQKVNGIEIHMLS